VVIRGHGQSGFEVGRHDEGNRNPRHNIACIDQELGRYGTVHQLWQDTCKAYHKRFSQALTEHDAEYLFNYSNVHAGTLGNRIVGALLYRIGLELDASHTRMRANLGNLYMEQKKHAKSSEVRNRFQSLARRTWNKAEALLQERQTPDVDVETLIELGSLSLEMADRERAQESFRRALKIRSKAPRVHAGLGEVHRQAGQRPLAIHHLRQAVSATPNDLDLRTKLARVYLEDGQITICWDIAG
jgi:tetratricopeptide (TPR) repeat protein